MNADEKSTGWILASAAPVTTTAFTWDREERRYRDRFGRYVSRERVRESLDRYVDNLQAEAGDITQRLVDGEKTISEWQEGMASLIKRGHVAATAIAKGGHEQVDQAGWGRTGQILRVQYQYLQRFADQLEQGRPVNGGTVARAQMYAIAPTSTFENLLRADDIEAGFDVERRILHSVNPCRNCVKYAAMGWQPAGILPGIAQRCQCLTRCRCTFERYRSQESRRKRRGLVIMALNRMATLEDNPACHRRRRRAALRDGVEGIPVRLHAERWTPVSAGHPTLKYSEGELPPTTDEALQLINAKRKALGQRPVKLATSTEPVKPFGKSRLKGMSDDEVYIHYMEAANDSFIGDRFMFLDHTTLKNVARGAKGRGFSFMNSHRTGGMSEPTELPYGRTFAGRYEEHETPDGKAMKRAIVGVYMMKGHYPNGANAPGTDDFHTAIEGGTLTDVSMGLAGGMRVCDVCGSDVSELDEDTGEYACPHGPGTSAHMSDEEREAQEARGVTRGYASYTLVDARPQEVSAVYMGAVPGAGFRKTLSLSVADPTLSRTIGREVLASYGPMLTGPERLRFGGGPATIRKGSGPMPFDFMKAFRNWKASGSPPLENVQDIALLVEDDDDDAGRHAFPPGHRMGVQPPPRATPATPEPDPKLVERERKANLREARLDAREYLSTLTGKLTPAERDGLEAAYILAHMDDLENPASNLVSLLDESQREALGRMTGDKITRVALLKLAQEKRGPAPAATGKTDLVGDRTVLKPGEKAIEPAPVPPDGDTTAAEDRKTMELMASSEGGRIALQATEEGRKWLASVDGRAFLASIGKA